MKYKPPLSENTQRVWLYPKGQQTPTADFTCIQILYVAELTPSLRRTLWIFRWQTAYKNCIKQIFIIYKYTQVHFSSPQSRDSHCKVSCNMSDILTKQEVCFFLCPEQQGHVLCSYSSDIYPFLSSPYSASSHRLVCCLFILETCKLVWFKRSITACLYSVFLKILLL